MTRHNQKLRARGNAKRLQDQLSQWEAKGRHSDGAFDELLVGTWLHVEVLTPNTVWFRIGERSFHATFDPHGNVTWTEQ